jgi:uncharacterized protein (TIGR01244 family)
MSLFRLFSFSFLVTAGVLLGMMYVNRPERFSGQLTRLSHGVYVTAQLKPTDLVALRRTGIWTIIDVRPDGEAEGQPTSKAMEVAAKRLHMHFHYIPVPHESIPEDAVEDLQDALANDPDGVALYCRTGRRAARLYALREAGRADGPTIDAILEMVKRTGFSAEDLKEDIARRISKRADSAARKTD